MVNITNRHRPKRNCETLLARFLYAISTPNTLAVYRKIHAPAFTEQFIDYLAEDYFPHLSGHEPVSITDKLQLNKNDKHMIQVLHTQALKSYFRAGLDNISNKSFFWYGVETPKNGSLNLTYKRKDSTPSHITVWGRPTMITFFLSDKPIMNEKDVSLHERIVEILETKGLDIIVRDIYSWQNEVSISDTKICHLGCIKGVQEMNVYGYSNHNVKTRKLKRYKNY